MVLKVLRMDWPRLPAKSEGSVEASYLYSPGSAQNSDDLALLDDDHALAVVDGDQRAVGNDIVLALGVGRTGGSALPALLHQDILIQRVTVEILAPLIRKHAAHSAADGFNQSHIFFPLFCGSPAYFRMNSTFLF